jgi:3-methylcrotonyl-CoA carboxylase alpha subunit
LEELTVAFKFLVEGRPHEIEIVRRRPHLLLRIDGREHEVSAPGDGADGRQTIEVAGLPVHFTRAQAGDRQIVRIGGRNFETSLIDPRSEAEGVGGGLDQVKAPMPGAVVTVHKSAGAAVKRGEGIVTIESMKLQMALPAPRDGVIAELMRKEGETFEKDEVIARLTPLGEEK